MKSLENWLNLDKIKMWLPLAGEKRIESPSATTFQHDSRHERFIMLTYEKAHKLLEYLPNGELKRKITTSPRAKVGDIVGNIGKRGYKYFSIDGKKYYNHRIIWFLHYGFIPNYIDHIDGNKVNNKIENLRSCNLTQNICNAKTRKDNTSGYKGVSWFKPYKKWKARVHIYGKEYHLGYFSEKQDAIEVVKKARNKIHKEFARHA